MTSEFSLSMDDDCHLDCGICCVKLEKDPPHGFDQLSLKAQLYPESKFKSVSVFEALVSIFKIKNAEEFVDVGVTLCFDCTTTLRELYMIWLSFVAKASSNSIFCRFLTSVDNSVEELEKTDATNEYGDILLTTSMKMELPQTDRLQAKIARRPQSGQNEDNTSGVRRSKRKRPNNSDPTPTSGHTPATSDHRKYSKHSESNSYDTFNKEVDAILGILEPDLNDDDGVDLVAENSHSSSDSSDTDESSVADSNPSDSDFDPEEYEPMSRKQLALLRKSLKEESRLNPEIPRKEKPLKKPMSKQERKLKMETEQAMKEMETTGQPTKQFVCDICGRRFLNKKNLTSHSSHTHGKIYFKCTMENCEQQFGKPELLEAHVNKHLGAKPFNCDQCEFSTSSQQLLDYHSRKHIKPEELDKLKTKVCDVCGAKFVNNTLLRNHMSVHTEERPWICSFEGCNKKFKTKSGLRLHEKEVHSDSSKHVCERCGREFTRKQNLMRHFQQHHK